MTTKANAHFVDGDIKSLTPATWSWQQGDSTAAYTLTYVSEPGKIWGIPLYDTTLKYLDNAAAVDLGGGLVGIPSAGHPFRNGATVKFTGTTGYTAAAGYVLQAGSAGTNYLIISTAFVAESFAGTETAVEMITVAAGLGRTVQDASGNIYCGHNYSNNTHITKIASDGTVTYDDFTPTAGWPGGVNAVSGLALTDDYTYLYVAFDVAKKVYKFNVSTGAEEWNKVIPRAGYDLDVDDDDNVWMCNVGSAGTGSWYYEAGKLDKADGTITTVANTQATSSVVVDNTMVLNGVTGVAIFGGINDWYDDHTTYTDGKNLHVVSLDGTQSASTRVGDLTLVAGHQWRTDRIPKRGMCVFDDHIYIADITNETLYKYEPDLSSYTSVAITDLTGIYIDVYGNMVVICYNGVGTNFYFYDENLAYISTVAGLPLVMFSTWTAASYISGTSHLYPGFEHPTASQAMYIDQSRTIAYPQDRKHLIGQTVQILGDGIYLGDDVVDSNGLITLDDATTVNHVGLKVVSKLQPMKIDGESDVKRIRQLIPDVYESVGGEYGEELTDMYSMKLRASGDPMDKDGALYTGYVELPFEGEYDRQGDIWITQDIPLPMIVLGIGVRLSKEAI